MSVESAGAVSVVAPALWLTLRIRSDDYSGSPAGLPDALDVAGLLGTMEALGRLSDVAFREEIPVAYLVASWTRSPPPGLPASPTRKVPSDVPRVIRPEGDVWWALRREFDVSDDDIAPPAPDILRVTHDWRDPMWRRPVTIQRLHFGSPLEIIAALPWDWFGPAGGGMVFLRVLEHWLQSPQSIRVARANLREREAVHRANEAEALKRKLVALQDIERLKSVNNLAQLEDGELRFD